MFLTTIEDAPESKYRGCINYGQHTVFRDPDVHDYPGDAREAIEALFAKHLGALLTHRVAEDMQAQIDAEKDPLPTPLGQDGFE